MPEHDVPEGAGRCGSAACSPELAAGGRDMPRTEIEVDGTRTRVLVDQMRAVDASRLGDFAGRLDATETGEIDRAVRLMLGVL